MKKGALQRETNNYPGNDVPAQREKGTSRANTRMIVARESRANTRHEVERRGGRVQPPCQCGALAERDPAPRRHGKRRLAMGAKERSGHFVQRGAVVYGVMDHVSGLHNAVVHNDLRARVSTRG